MSGIQLLQNTDNFVGNEVEKSSGGPHKCTHELCDYFVSGFGRARDLKRHLQNVHDKKNKKRRCPYPKSKCKIMCDEKHQLTNWYDHIVTKHKGYRFVCDDCGKSWSSRRGADKHFKKTDHRCKPSQWGDVRKERELAEKDRLYQMACSELMSKRRGGEIGAWDDSWAESLPEYEAFMRKKGTASKRPPAPPTMNFDSVWSSPSLTTASTSTAPRPRRHRHFQPYLIPEGRATSHSSDSVATWSQQVVVEGSLADLAVPRLSEEFQSQEAYAEARAAPPEGLPYVSSPVVSAHVDGARGTVGSSALLSHDDARPRGFLTQEEADYWYAYAISNPPNMAPCASRTSDVFWSPSPSLESIMSDSSYSATVPTPPNFPLATFDFDNCVDRPLNGLENVSPHSLHFSPPASWHL